MVIDLNYFSNGAGKGLGLFPADQRRDIMEMVQENQIAREGFIGNFAGLKRVVIDPPPFLKGR